MTTATVTATAEPIFVYTREEAIADGILVDAKSEPYMEVTRQHHGETPVFLTRSLADLIARAVAHPRHCNDTLGVWHDICFLARIYCGRTFEPGQHRPFRVIITGWAGDGISTCCLPGTGRLSLTCCLGTGRRGP